MQAGGPECCSAEEVIARVKLLQDHFCSYQVPMQLSAAVQSPTSRMLLRQPDCEKPTAATCCTRARWLIAWLQCHWNASQSRLAFLPQNLAVPVVPVSTAGLSNTLEVLHDYLLQCMELAMAADP